MLWDWLERPRLRIDTSESSADNAYIVCNTFLHKDHPKTSSVFHPQIAISNAILCPTVVLFSTWPHSVTIRLVELGSSFELSLASNKFTSTFFPDFVLSLTKCDAMNMHQVSKLALIWISSPFGADGKAEGKIIALALLIKRLLEGSLIHVV